jgi:opacity protein-like surface antigen
MKVSIIVAAAALLAAAPSFAQGTRGFVGAAGGFAVAPDGTSGDVVGELGARIAPNLFLFADLGQFRNLQPSQLQPAVDSTDATLSAGGLSVVGEARVPAWYSMGGLRFTIPTSTRFSPYVFGGAGFARLTPSAQFTYSSGTLPGATPIAGDDVTSQLVSLGDFTQPQPSTAFMFAAGGGVETPIAPHIVADVGYRVSRVAADAPLNAQSVTFGIGYRF